VFFYLYLFIDLFSRKIVGWEVYEEESAEHAATIFRKTYMREGIAGDKLTLHSDNGSPMKGATMRATLQYLGVQTSFSRPSVSNDNAFSEAMFRTLKYHPAYPGKPFDTLEEARQWVKKFQHWYNEEHRHSALNFVTPGQRHRGEDQEILRHRSEIYASAKAKRPERWSGESRNWDRPEGVILNPQKPRQNDGKTEVIAN
jgi:transposase InsO family protein